MTDVTVKTLPRAETERTVLVLGLGEAAAGKLMTAVMGSFADATAAAHLSSPLAERLAETATAGAAVTALRLEGVAPSVAHRQAVLEELARSCGRLATLEEASSRTLWRAIRDATPLAAAGPTGARDVWRISTAPARGFEIGRALVEQAEAEVLYDWAGGLIWAALPPSDDAKSGLVRSIVAGAGGHATLIRAPAAVRATVDVFEPETPALAALTKRVRESFDPRGVLNPGRMWAGV
jgi:glycolate oxidase FAD binding subunit